MRHADGPITETLNSTSYVRRRGAGSSRPSLIFRYVNVRSLVTARHDAGFDRVVDRDLVIRVIVAVDHQLPCLG